jgi:acyl dehydratase
VASLDAAVVPGRCRWEEVVEIPPTAAHVYTECSRIWNPIHTDLAVARAAGLPGLILHGTASLALAVSRLVRRDLDGDPLRVCEVSARFTGMVPMPAVLTVRGHDAVDTTLGFEVVDEDGRAVVAAGRVRACSR